MSDCLQSIAFALVCFQSGIYVGCISLLFTLPSALHSREQTKLMFFICFFVALLNGVWSDLMKSYFFLCFNAPTAKIVYF